VKQDVTGVSFNNLGFVYNLKTRRVADGLAVIPIDLNTNGKIDTDEQIYKTVDDVIAFIEKTNHAAFVTERVNVLFNKDSKNEAAGIFLHWVLSKGQKFNHDLGFLYLEPSVLEEQKIMAGSNFNLSTSSSCGGTTELLHQRKLKAVN
jgi:phosphate transport system substrate-binding protein